MMQARVLLLLLVVWFGSSDGEPSAVALQHMAVFESGSQQQQQQQLLLTHPSVLSCSSSTEAVQRRPGV